MLSIEEYYKDIPDPEELLSSSNALKSIVQFEKTVEIIGIVDTIQNRDDLFKFILHNQEGDRVQVLAWGNEAKRIQGYIIMNSVVHIDGAFAKVKNSTYSKGTIKYDLTIMSNTRVNVLKKINKEMEESEADEIPIVKIENIMEVEGVAAVEGHLNSEFTSMVLLSGAKLGLSCLVDKEYKLEVRVQNFTDDYSKFKENQHVKIIGQMFNHQSIPYLLVTSFSNIKVISDNKLPLHELLKGTKVPKRKVLQPTANNNNNKRIKNEGE